MLITTLNCTHVIVFVCSSKVGEQFSSLGLQFIPGPIIHFLGHVSIASSQIIDDWMNVLNMISCFFSFFW